ncbi:MAG: glycosyltransferase family 2 protein [Thermoprotei archaeon]
MWSVNLVPIAFGLLVCVVDLGVWVWLTYRLAHGLSASPHLDDSSVGLCRVDAVVAMRNEADNVFGCVQSLLAQECVGRVIMVDDHSDDDTLSIAHQLAKSTSRLSVISLQDKEAWGKAEACWVGATHSDAEWLLFVDADTRLTPTVVGRALALAERRGVDALSILGGLRCSSVTSESFSSLNVGLLNAFVNAGDVNNPAKRSAYFAGSFILARRSKYLELGGHGAVRGEIVEDKALADLYKRKGLGILLCYAPHDVSTAWGGGRGDGVVASMVREITPSMASAGVLNSALFSVGMSMLHLAPYIGLALGFITTKPLDILFFSCSVGSILMALLFQTLSLRLTAGRMTSLPAYFIAFPLQVAAFWVGVYKVWRKKPVRWRGRIYRPVERLPKTVS